MSLRQGCKGFFAAKKILHCNSRYAMKMHDEGRCLNPSYMVWQKQSPLDTSKYAVDFLDKVMRTSL